MDRAEPRLGAFPEWELGLQLFDDEFADSFGFDILDPTKLILEELVTIRKVGRLVLDRVVDNFFAETEQVAFMTHNIVPGIDFTNDPLLQGRNFSYLDTQLKRLAQNADLLDGIAGLRGRVVLGSGFDIPFAVDVGAGGSNSTWQAMGGIAYQTGWAGVTLGYRHLSYTQNGGELIQSLNLSGPFIAMNMTF